VSIMCTEES
jgi:hypothetical protein